MGKESVPGSVGLSENKLEKRIKVFLPQLKKKDVDLDKISEEDREFVAQNIQKIIGTGLVDLDVDYFSIVENLERVKAIVEGVEQQ